MNEETQEVTPQFAWDSQDAFDTGYEAMNGDERDDIAATTVGGYMPYIELDNQGNVAYGNTEAAHEQVQAWCQQAKKNKLDLNKDTYTRAARLVVADIMSDPDNANADTGTLSKICKQRISIHGLDQMLFSDEADPAGAAEAFMDSVINGALNARVGSANLKQICTNAISNYVAADPAKDAYLRGREILAKGKLAAIAGVKDDPNSIEDDYERQQIRERYERYTKAIDNEILLRAQDDLSAFMLEHPQATDAQKYAVVRNSARRNYNAVRDQVITTPNYLDTFATERDKANAERASRYAKEAADARKLLTPYQQAGEALGRIEATEQAKRKVREQEVAKLARSTERARFYEENPALDTKAKAKAEKEQAKAQMHFTSGKGVSSNVGLSHAMADQPPTLILPRADYERLMQEMNLQEGEGATVVIGTGKNAHSVPVCAGDVSAPAMNHAMFKAVYFGKNSKLTDRDIQTRASGYRQTLRFYKTRTRKTK